MGNSLTHPDRGAANTKLIRISYIAQYANGSGAMLTTADRANPRTISNTLSAQSASQPNARGLSDFLWGWGQFLDHDMSLSTTSHGAAVNGSAPIAVGPGDLLGPNPIPFTRSNFVNPGVREQVNEVTAWIDGSQVYGSNAARAAALRTGGGTGAKLATGAGDLLPFNTGGLPNQNQGPTPASQLFIAGDIRANENPLLTSLHTVFMREHNRLVDQIAVQQPALNAEQQYQLARKIVGAEIQAITYREFLPALLGNNAPSAQHYNYQPDVDGSITNSFAHAAFRFGHSTLSTELTRVNSNGAMLSAVPLHQAFFNPGAITANPSLVDQLLAGAAAHVSQEIDVQVVDSVRNMLFGPPGAGGMDLAAINIQRGRDHGLPHYNMLRERYDLLPLVSFSQITSDPVLRQKLETIYQGDINNIDVWVGGLAENHLPGTSLGPLFTEILVNQFTRLRDGDRLFYRANASGLYTNGALSPQIQSLVNLDAVRLSDILEWNTGITTLQDNVFFAASPPVSPMTMAMWRAGFGVNADGDVDGDGDTDGGDFLLLQGQSGNSGGAAAVPEPAFQAWAAFMAMIALARWPLVRSVGAASGRQQ
jgi:hypothetical protein